MYPEVGEEPSTIPIVVGSEPGNEITDPLAAEKILLKEKLEEHDDFSKQVFQCVSENTYGAAIVAFLFVRQPDVALYCTIPLALSWLVQLGFITYLSGAYMDEPVLSKETLSGSDAIPQLISVGYFILQMLSGMEWLFTSAYICLFSTKYKKDDAIFDLATKSVVVFKSKSEVELIKTTNSVSGKHLILCRAAGFLLCTVAEAAVWVAVLLVGVQYIMWSGTKGETASEKAASILWACLSFTWIMSVDEKVFEHVLPTRFKEKLKDVKFQVKPFQLSEAGNSIESFSVGGLRPAKFVPKFKALNNSAQFLLPSILLAAAAVGAVFAQRQGVIIEWPRI